MSQAKFSREDREAMLAAVEMAEDPSFGFVAGFQDDRDLERRTPAGVAEMTAPDDGAVRNDQGKARFDLISPWFLQELAGVVTFGAAKYGERNWERGMTLGRAFASLQRHMWAFWDGQDFDPESGLQHVAHAAANLMFISDYWRRVADGTLPAEVDDRPFVNRAPNQGNPRS